MDPCAFFKEKNSKSNVTRVVRVRYFYLKLDPDHLCQPRRLPQPFFLVYLIFFVIQFLPTAYSILLFSQLFISPAFPFQLPASGRLIKHTIQYLVWTTFSCRILQTYSPLLSPLSLSLSLFLSCPGFVDCLKIAHPEASKIFQCLLDPTLKIPTITIPNKCKVHPTKTPNTPAVSILKTNYNHFDPPLLAIKVTMPHLVEAL